MSSSLLLVLIVVVWLFVLAPLVINTRQPIRRTSEALGRTRLLHRGGESVPTRRRRPLLSERDIRRTDDEDDDLLETVDAVPADDVDSILIDDSDDGAADGAAVREDAAAAADKGAAAAEAGEASGAESDASGDATPAIVEGDVVYELEAGAGTAEDGAENDAEGAELTADGPDAADAAAAVDAGATARTAADAPRDEDVRAYLSPEDFLLVDEDGFTEPEDEDDGEDAAESRADLEAVDDPADADALADDGEPDAEADELDAEADAADEGADAYATDADAEMSDDLTDEDLEFAERRRGRGGFDPVSDARYTETRFARRRRSVAALLAVIVATVAVGLLVGGWTWWLPLAGTGLLVLYLVYLRRTVIEEKELRARRIRRMKMARLGVRNREDEELGIPARLRRPGAVVVELDDEDPEFADLPYATYEYEDEDLRRAAGA